MAGNNFNVRNMGHDVSDQPRLSNGQFTFKGSATAATMPSHRQQTVLVTCPQKTGPPKKLV